MNWYEKLGKVVAQECSLEEGSEIEHQLGTVWVTDSDGNVVAISGIVPEDNV
jgi:hypothetical protein